MTDTLPPLPNPAVYNPARGVSGNAMYSYTADQMIEYALKAMRLAVQTPMPTFEVRNIILSAATIEQAVRLTEKYHGIKEQK